MVTFLNHFLVIMTFKHTVLLNWFPYASCMKLVWEDNFHHVLYKISNDPLGLNSKHCVVSQNNLWFQIEIGTPDKVMRSHCSSETVQHQEVPYHSKHLPNHVCWLGDESMQGGSWTYCCSRRITHYKQVNTTYVLKAKRLLYHTSILFYLCLCHSCRGRNNPFEDITTQ